MTSPVTHDQPDWHRTVSSTDIKIYSNTVTLAAGPNVLGTFFVGNLPSIQLALGVVGGGALLEVVWQGTASGSTVLARNSIHVLDLIDAQGSLPVLGPYVRFIATPDAAGRDFTLNAYQGLALGQDTRPAVGNQLISVDLVAVPTGVATNFDAGYVRWGWGYWHAYFELGVTFRFRLLARSYLGATTLIDFVPASSNQPGQIITLPAMPMRLEAFQVDGVNRNALATLLFHPGPL